MPRIRFIVACFILSGLVAGLNAGCQKPTKFAYTGPRVYIIEGADWERSDGLRRIRDELQRNEIATEVYSPDNWLKIVRDIDKRPSEEAILVGHGHGAFLCTQVARDYAQHHKTKLIEAVFAIDPYNKDWPGNCCRWICCDDRCDRDDRCGDDNRCASGGACGAKGKCGDGGCKSDGCKSKQSCGKRDRCDDRDRCRDASCCNASKSGCERGSCESESKCDRTRRCDGPTPIPVGHNVQKVYVYNQCSPGSRVQGADLVTTRASNVAEQHPYYWYDHYWCDRPITGQRLGSCVCVNGIAHCTIDNEAELVQRIVRMCRKEALSPFHYTPSEHYVDVSTPLPAQGNIEPGALERR